MREIAAGGPRVVVLTADFTNPIVNGLAQEIGPVDYIVHMGGETHINRSIEDPEPFVMSNVLGTMHVLNFARSLPHCRSFLYFSTDEVFGPARDEDRFGPWARYHSSNPYAATKAGGEELAMAYANTYGLLVTATHCANIFGERQHPEKFLPLAINKILHDDVLMIHADSRGHPLRRQWVHAQAVADAVLFLLENASPCAKYNIVAGCEMNVLRLAERVAQVLGRPLRHEVVRADQRRPGYDVRYGIDGSALRMMGWRGGDDDFDGALRRTVEWYAEHPEWLEPAS
jgi:dTDP-glucose 4,6-dehydratase